jgi:hypothetical protein
MRHDCAVNNHCCNDYYEMIFFVRVIFLRVLKMMQVRTPAIRPVMYQGLPRKIDCPTI